LSKKEAEYVQFDEKGVLNLITATGLLVCEKACID
jgi:hypothetical protein